MDESGKIVNIKVKVNGTEYRVDVPANMTLLQFLRERLYLTGAKEGCGIGECGACTVIMDGKAVASCLILAAEADGSSIRTIEGEASGGNLTPLQKAFIEMGAIQCGFCTPGLIMAAQSLLERNPKPSKEEIIEVIAGNLCRCTGYEPVIRAIEVAAGLKTRSSP